MTVSYTAHSYGFKRIGTPNFQSGKKHTLHLLDESYPISCVFYLENSTYISFSPELFYKLVINWSKGLQRT